MCHVPWVPDTKGPAQWREGRMRILGTPFETFEGHVKHQLSQALADYDFDPERDISAITVNRWPHGYAYSSELIWEPDYADEEDKPWVIGRKPVGRIHVANSDAGAKATRALLWSGAPRDNGNIDLSLGSAIRSGSFVLQEAGRQWTGWRRSGRHRADDPAPSGVSGAVARARPRLRTRAFAILTK